MKARKGQLDITQLIIFVGIALVLSLVIFMIIGQLESQIKLTGTWNTTYTNFRTAVTNVFPLLSTLIIVTVAVAIIWVVLTAFYGGGRGE